MLSEENGRKINIKPLPVSNKGLRGAGDPSYARLSRMDMNQASSTSLNKKVEENFIAPIKLVEATKKDLLAHKQNPNDQRKF